MYRVTFLVIVAFAALACTNAEETTCQSHQKASRNNVAHGDEMTWVITCHEQTKKYSPSLQCTKNGKWCACYTEEEAVTNPSMKIKHCDCRIAKHNQIKAGIDESKTIKCENDGLYKERQKHQNGTEYCVNKNSGQTVTCP